MGKVFKILFAACVAGVFCWIVAAAALAPFGVPLEAALFFAGAGAGAIAVSHAQRGSRAAAAQAERGDDEAAA